MPILTICLSSFKILFYEYWGNIFSPLDTLGNITNSFLRILNTFAWHWSCWFLFTYFMCFIFSVFSSHTNFFLNSLLSPFLFPSFLRSPSFFLYPLSSFLFLLSSLSLSPFSHSLLRPWWNQKQTTVRSSSLSNKGTYVLS